MQIKYKNKNETENFLRTFKFGAKFGRVHKSSMSNHVYILFFYISALFV